MEQDRIVETWFVYHLPPRLGLGDLALPVTTYLAGKRSERSSAEYERAWRCYLLARQAMQQHPRYAAQERWNEPRVLYDIGADEVMWLFRTQPEGESILVTARMIGDLEALRIDRDVCALPFAVQVQAPTRAV